MCAAEVTLAPEIGTVLAFDDQQLVVGVEDDLQARLSQLARLQAALAANRRDREPREWAAQTDFPYLAAFDREEVDEFARETLA